jgi:hypothetical protein
MLSERWAELQSRFEAICKHSLIKSGCNGVQPGNDLYFRCSLDLYRFANTIHVFGSIGKH